MLDQNTDRMWYVIGAVIVGAALIFLMNGAFPTLFGTIGGVFQEKVTAVTQEEIFTGTPGDNEQTDGAVPVQPNRNLIPDSANTKLWAYPAKPIESYIDGWTRVALPTEAVEFGSGKEIVVLPDTEYTQSFTIKTDAAVSEATVSFFEPAVGHVLIEDTVVTQVSANEWRVVATGKTTVAQRLMRVPDFYVTFEGGTYAEFGSFKLEEGRVATPWVE